MPSENSPAFTQDRVECPDIAEEIGHDPARFLDHDITTPDFQRLDIERDSDGSVADTRLIPDHNASTGAELPLAVISGIDRLDVLDAWLEVETERLDRGPRKAIIAALNQRRAELEEIGERPDRLPEGLRRPPESCHEGDGSDEQAADGQDDDQLTAMEQLGQQQAATDGGEDA